MPRTPGSGRQKGTPNKATRAAKEFLTDLIEDAKVQAVVRERILSGDTAGFFKAVDKIVPDPPKDVNVKGEFKMIEWPDGEDISEE